MTRLVDADGLAYFYKKLQETFISKKEVADIQKLSSCPHCCAPFTDSEYCEYCGSYLGSIIMINNLGKHETQKIIYGRGNE